MKYIKLFEDFKDSGNMSNELIQKIKAFRGHEFMKKYKTI